MNKNCIPNIFYALIMTAFIAGCGKQVTDIPTIDLKTSTEPITSSLPSQIGIPETKTLAQETTPTSNPLPSVTPASTTRKYQLTFLINDRDSSTGLYNATELYATNISCLDQEFLCFSDPFPLFKITRGGKNPIPPIVAYSWSPDGRRIVVCAPGVEGNFDIYLGDAEGKTWINLTHSPIDECNPVWLPDNQNIIFSASSYDLYKGNRLFELNVKNFQKIPLLTSTSVVEPGSPSLSPNGRQIVIEDYINGFYQIFLASLYGKSILQLTHEKSNNYSPSFSQDGQWIVFSRELDTDNKIYGLFIIHPNGSDELKLSEGNMLLTPHWAPFGNWIAYSISIELNPNTKQLYNEIHLIQYDGKHDTTVFQDERDVNEPGWRTIPPA